MSLAGTKVRQFAEMLAPVVRSDDKAARPGLFWLILLIPSWEIGPKP
jgi:hypothetical protein